MGIPIYLEDFKPAMKEILVKLDKILQYNANFDEEVFTSLSRIEQALIELSKKPIPKKVK